MVSASKTAAQNVIKQAGLIDSRGHSDTIRMWESYKDQATMWRAISLLQIPATCIALIFSLIMWSNKTIILNVPSKPQPGMISVQEIPDTEFIDQATEFLNLVASYQHNLARKQFEKAAEMLQEPLLTRFVREISVDELKTIETTNRTQMFFADPEKISVSRDTPQPRQVTIEMSGERLKIVAGKELPLIKTKFTVVMTTMPRNKLNPYGIVILDYFFEDLVK